MKLFEKKALKKAQDLGDSSTESDLKKIDSNLSKMNKGIVSQIWDKVLFLWEKAKSPEVPLRLKLTIIGALLYLILPVDVIPDSLPVIGFVDDVSVILLVFREVSDYLIPKAVTVIKNKTEVSIIKHLDENLKKAGKKYLIYSGIFLAINICGCLILVLNPFGKDISRIVAVGLFFTVMVWSMARTINYLSKKGLIILKAVKTVIKNKSIRKGCTEIVIEKYPVIAKVYAGIDIMQQFIPSLETIPDLDEIVDDLINHYKKMVIFTGLIIVIYSIFLWLLKMFLLRM